MYVYNSFQPPPQRLTQRDVDAAVLRTLDRLPPEPSWQAEAYQLIRPSVVRIETVIPGDKPRPDSGLGTGVVIDEAGTILTNFHVIEDASRIKVTFWDGTESDAVVVATEPENDLAVIRAELLPDDLLPATLAGSPRVGEEVAAVGNPFGIGTSLTSGVVSGLGRNFKSEKTGRTLNNMIQFDAAVNPGNSGGPLINRDGEVVGIVTAIMNPTDQEVFIGIGLAIPIETAGGVGGTPPV